VQLTQDGMVYYERAKDLLANMDELDGCFCTIRRASAGGCELICPWPWRKTW
jgi:DNA-binding transcriptional LysR family regulator